MNLRRLFRRRPTRAQFDALVALVEKSHAQNRELIAELRKARAREEAWQAVAVLWQEQSEGWHARYQALCRQVESEGESWKRGGT